MIVVYQVYNYPALRAIRYYRYDIRGNEYITVMNRVVVYSR
jgi:hypothetical protein